MKIRYTVTVETAFIGDSAHEQEPDGDTELDRLKRNAMIAAGEEAIRGALLQKEETTGFEHTLDHGMQVHVVDVGCGYKVNS